jgi:excinuclease ABC subunit C
LYLLQRIRDEAHRFAITHHRGRRSRSMVESALDDVPGLGEVRRKALLRQFRSMKRLRAARVEEIAAVPGIGRRTAESVVLALSAVSPPAEQPAASAPAALAVNTATGELLEDDSVPVPHPLVEAGPATGVGSA